MVNIDWRELGEKYKNENYTLQEIAHITNRSVSGVNYNLRKLGYLGITFSQKLEKIREHEIFNEVAEIVIKNYHEEFDVMCKEVDLILDDYLGDSDDYLWKLMSLCSYLDVDRGNAYLLARTDFSASNEEIEELVKLLKETGLYEILYKWYWSEN